MRKPRTRRLASTATVVVALSVAVTACSSTDSSSANNSASGSGSCSNTVTIGSVESLSGIYAALGATMSGSVAMGVHDVNKTGFVVQGKCYHFKLVKADAQSTPAGAALGATKLVQSGATFIFGPAETAEALGAQPVVNASKSLWFTGSTVIAQSLYDGAAKSDTTYANSYAVLEPAGVLSQNLATMAKVLLPDAKTAALLLPDVVTATPYVKYLTQYFKDQGISVVKTTLYSQTATDYTADLTAIKAASPDILVTGTSNTVEVQTVASEMETLGGVAKMLMSTIGNPAIGLTGNGGKPLTFPFVYANTGSVNVVDRPQSLVSYVADFEDVTGAAVPDPYVNLSTTQWPAVTLLALAMSKAGTVTDVDQINNALTQVSLTNDPGFPGKTLQFNASHLMEYPATVGTVVDGQAHAQVAVPSA
jgi:branched-chain amino acid transport system substrate-binding protein